MHQPRIPVVDSFDWMEFLNLADELAVDTALQSTIDAKLRSAISRAYYAVFHRAKTKFLPARATGFGSHNEVIDLLERSDDLTRRQLGVGLKRLKNNRTKADYDDIVRNMPALAEDSLVAARELINSCDSF
jgi:uncharacterized protein (UPF0332 family)